MPAAPATQPRPTSGIRFTSGRSPTWAAIRASSDGTARPVTVAADDEVDVGRREPRGLQGVDERTGTELDRMLDEQVVGRAEVAELGVAVELEHHVPRLAPPRCGAAAAAPPRRRPPSVANVGERVGELLLRVAMTRTVRYGRTGSACGSSWSGPSGDERSGQLASQTRRRGADRSGRRPARARRARRTRGGRGRRRGSPRRRRRAREPAGRRSRCA